MPLFPIVPNVPGVPPVYRSVANIINTGTVLFQDVLTAISFFTQQQSWGIYLDGIPVITADTVADNVVSQDFKQSYTVANYPVEPGSFETYDKVTMPFEVRMRFSVGGSDLDRQSLLDTIDAIAGDLNLYDFVSPEATYSSVNITHYDYSRKGQAGAGLLVIDVWGVQVRTDATAQFSSSTDNQPSTGAGSISIKPISSPSDPSASSQVSNGNVLPSTSTPYTGPIY